MASLPKDIDLPEKQLKYKSNNKTEMKPYNNKMNNIKSETIWFQQYLIIYLKLKKVIKNRMMEN